MRDLFLLVKTREFGAKECHERSYLWGWVDFGWKFGDGQLSGWAASEWEIAASSHFGRRGNGGPHQ